MNRLASFLCGVFLTFLGMSAFFNYKPAYFVIWDGINTVERVFLDRESAHEYIREYQQFADYKLLKMNVRTKDLEKIQHEN